MGADEAGDHPAAVDVADEDDRNIGRLGKSHVGDVAGAQVDLGRASRALDEDDVHAVADPREALEHPGQQLRLPPPVFRGPHRPGTLALNNDLRPGLALRLEEHRVHVDRRRKPGGPRLQRLRPADLAAVRQ